jgi:tetratricopeptide (TPR) repeat protein
MTSLRTLYIIQMAFLALGLAASPVQAQPSAPLPDGSPAPESQAGEHAPDSPAAEAAQRARRLDGLFAKLAQRESTSWQRVENDIWSQWSRSGSASMDLLLHLAAKAMDERDLDRALKFLNDLVRLAPDFAEGWNKRATVYFLRGDYGRSIADIQRVLALEPRHFGAISGLGIILERLGDKKGALTAFRHGLEIHPNLRGAQEAVERLAPDVDGREL